MGAARCNSSTNISRRSMTRRPRPTRPARGARPQRVVVSWTGGETNIATCCSEVAALENLGRATTPELYLHRTLASRQLTRVMTLMIGMTAETGIRVEAATVIMTILREIEAGAVLTGTAEWDQPRHPLWMEVTGNTKLNPQALASHRAAMMTVRTAKTGAEEATAKRAGTVERY